ncbi:MAG: hypothetical protein CL696_02700 [Chloroflexi bacterium]|nr:hypothetical protein [Chloroflexota bacterium]
MVAGHDIAEDVHHQMLHNLKYLCNPTVHVDPGGLAGEEEHRHGLGKMNTIMLKNLETSMITAIPTTKEV